MMQDLSFPFSTHTNQIPSSERSMLKFDLNYQKNITLLMEICEKSYFLSST